jgi:hypothetical protein
MLRVLHVRFADVNIVLSVNRGYTSRNIHPQAIENKMLERLCRLLT